MATLSRRKEEVGFASLLIIFFILILISGCVKTSNKIPIEKEIFEDIKSEQEKIPPKETPTTSPIKLDLSISPIDEEKFAEVTLTVKSERNVQDASGKIILPEAYELVEGNLEWKVDLEANEPEVFKLKVKSVKEGDWTIKAITEDNSVSAQLPTKINESQRHGVYINESEFYKNRTRSWSACYGFECFTLAERKGQDSINYFKSLNLTEDYIYVIMQFEDLGGDPSREEMDILAADNITLFEYHGDHSYYAKVPRTILETKSYNYVRWIGIAENASWKLHTSLGQRVNKNCTGNVMVSIHFYERFTDKSKVDLIINHTKSIVRYKEPYDLIRADVSLGNLVDISSFNFVKDIWPVIKPSICPDYAPNCGEDPFANITC